MTITIHRGTHEIGGSCVEIRTRQAKILLDLGLPLDFDARPQEQQKQIRRLARSIERRRYRTLHTTMPLPRKVFLAASTQYWLRYGQRFGTSRRQMETMQIEA